MPTPNREYATIIDMSARSKINIKTANQHEIEQRQKSLDELNKLITSEIEEYDKNLNTYISKLLENIKPSKKNVEYNNDKRYPLIPKKKYRLSMSFVILIFLIYIITNNMEIGNKIQIIVSNRDYFKSFIPNLKVKQETQKYDTQLYVEQETINVATLKYYSNFTQTIPTSDEYIENTSNNSIHIYKYKDFIAKDSLTGTEYTREQLFGKTLLVPYKENDKEIYFLGQYNQNYKWDGFCITNTYNSDGTLYGICEYNFNDGNCISCKSFYRSEQDGEWIYLNKEYDNNIGFGESIRYLFTYNDCKNFNNNDITVANILHIDEIIKTSNIYMLAYYNGKMSDGKFNDDSGTAYLITYFEPNLLESSKNVPIIKTFYQGKFSEGKYDEKEYDSWYITRGINTTYMFYKGGFSNGNVEHKDKEKEHFQNYLTHDQIDDYLREYGFLKYSNQFVTEYENIDN